MILESDIRKAFERCLITPWYPERWVILYKGSEVRLNSGKQVWARPNHALCALTNAYETILQQQPYSIRSRIPYAQRKTDLETFKKWRSENIQIVQQEDWIKNYA